MSLQIQFKKWLKKDENKDYLILLSKQNTETNKKCLIESNIIESNVVESNKNYVAFGTPLIKKRKLSLPTQHRDISIKPFYFKSYKRPKLLIEKEIDKITTEFTHYLSEYKDNDKGLNLIQFESITMNVIGITKYCNKILFNKILKHNNNDDNIVTLSMFINFWRCYFSENEDVAFRFIQILKQNDNQQNYLTKKDFEPLIKEILYNYPGLKFLRESNQDFHWKYIECVICTIFYYNDKSRNNKLELKELQKSNLFSILNLFNDYNDNNKQLISTMSIKNNYFSYQHFYVIYTKFWELDIDEDNLLSIDDLIKYDDYSLTPIVCHRIINGHWKKIKKKQTNNNNKNVMDFNDFIYFVISNEDKTNVLSLEYWFRILDIDGDGLISSYEISSFFNQQSIKIHKLFKNDTENDHQCDDKELVSFSNILTELNDIIRPKKDFIFSLSDIKFSSMGYLFFDILTNINKFVERNKTINDIDNDNIDDNMNDNNECEWDKWIKQEYMFLSN